MSKTAGRPYPGTEPFRETDRHRFFGRVAEAALLVQWWQQNRVTFLVGSAGRGKTSLLRAGVLPRLADANVPVLPIGRLSYGATFPFGALPGQNPYTFSLLRSWAPDEVATRLVGLTIREFVQSRVVAPVLAALDPADELLAVDGLRLSDRRRFLEELNEAIQAGGLHLLVVAREEAANVISEIIGNGVRYEVGPLTWSEAVEATSHPMSGAGRSFADGAAEKLVSGLQVSGADGAECRRIEGCVEPVLLQVVCTHLWDSLPDLELVTSRDVRRYGDVNVALSAWCGAVIGRVADDHDLSGKQLSSWLLNNFVTDDGIRDKKREGATAVAGMPNGVARALEDCHLFTSRWESRSRWYELLSDCLIEPLRQAPETESPQAAFDSFLHTAGHAYMVGDFALAQRCASEVLRAPLEFNVRLHAEAQSLLGNIDYERQKLKAAESHYREAMRLFGVTGDNRSVVDQLAAIGQVLLAQDRTGDAVDELYTAVWRMPNDLMIKTQLARALWQYGDGHAAVAFLTDVLRVDGGNRIALQARGEILAYLGDARRAMLDLDRVALRGQPSTRAARGLALAELGDQPAARREIEAAIREGRWNGMALLYAARASQAEGDDVAAREYARQAANATDPPLSPQHRRTARELADHGTDSRRTLCASG